MAVFEHIAIDPFETYTKFSANIEYKFFKDFDALGRKFSMFHIEGIPFYFATEKYNTDGHGKLVKAIGGSDIVYDINPTEVEKLIKLREEVRNSMKTEKMNYIQAVCKALNIKYTDDIKTLSNFV